MHTLDSTDQRQTNTTVILSVLVKPGNSGDQRIATGGFDEGVTRLDATRSLCLLDHAQGNAILHTATGIEVFQLGIDSSIDSEAAGQAIQSDERGIADLLGDGVESDRRNAGGSC